MKKVITGLDGHLMETKYHSFQKIILTFMIYTNEESQELTKIVLLMAIYGAMTTII